MKIKIIKRKDSYYVKSYQEKFAATGIMCLVLMAAGTTAYGAAPAPQPSTVQTQAVQNPVEDPTLGGLFELYTPEEYEESVNQIKKVHGR